MFNGKSLFLKIKVKICIDKANTCLYTEVNLVKAASVVVIAQYYTLFLLHLILTFAALKASAN